MRRSKEQQYRQDQEEGNIMIDDEDYEEEDEEAMLAFKMIRPNPTPPSFPALSRTTISPSDKSGAPITTTLTSKNITSVSPSIKSGELPPKSQQARIGSPPSEQPIKEVVLMEEDEFDDDEDDDDDAGLTLLDDDDEFDGRKISSSTGSGAGGVQTRRRGRMANEGSSSSSSNQDSSSTTGGEGGAIMTRSKRGAPFRPRPVSAASNQTKKKQKRDDGDDGDGTVGDDSFISVSPPSPSKASPSSSSPSIMGSFKTPSGAPTKAFGGSSAKQAQPQQQQSKGQPSRTVPAAGGSMFKFGPETQSTTTKPHGDSKAPPGMPQMSDILFPGASPDSNQALLSLIRAQAEMNNGSPNAGNMNQLAQLPLINQLFGGPLPPLSWPILPMNQLAPLLVGGGAQAPGGGAAGGGLPADSPFGSSAQAGSGGQQPQQRSQQQQQHQALPQALANRRIEFCMYCGEV